MSVIPVRKAPTPGIHSSPRPPSAIARISRGISRGAIAEVSRANREAMPQVAVAVDQRRSVFGPVQVVFAAEGGKELGQAPDPGVIAHPLPIPNNKRKARTEERSTPAARTSHGQPDREVTP